MSDKPTIQRYRFVVEREPDGTFVRAYAAPWEGSQEPGNDWVPFADVAAQVEAARKEERARIREKEVKLLMDALKDRLTSVSCSKAKAEGCDNCEYKDICLGKKLDEQSLSVLAAVEAEQRRET